MSILKKHSFVVETEAMKNSVMCAAVLSLLFILRFSNAVDSKFDGKTKRAHNKVFHERPHSGLISFNSEEEKLRIDWAVTIPFISIPVDHKLGEHGEVKPLLNVNTKALGVVGLITTLFSVIMPLFSKTHHPHHYRSEDSVPWLQMGSTMNEMIFGNNYVTPCMQRVVCSVVSIATHSDNPTSADKIIDGISSHGWFKDVTNGTIIQEAVSIGRNKNNDCSRIYRDCLVTPSLLKTMMNEFGLV